MGFLAAAGLTACVSTGPVTKKTAAPADMAAAYVQQAQALEQSGDIVQASHFYKLAQTVDPQNPTTAQSLARLETKRSQLAQTYYQKGVELFAKGKYADSRQSLLTALRLEPGHTGALEKLKSRPRIAAKRFIVHTVQPGDSISMIAKKYYGDPGKYAVIAQYNNLADATQIRLGQELKIPEIDGQPFNIDAQSQPVKTEAADTVPLAAWPSEETDGDPPPSIQATVENQVAGYQAAGLEFLGTQKYDAAIAEFDKVLSAQPHNTAVKGHLYTAHFEWGQELMREKKYIAAKGQFEKSLAVDSNCQECHGLITQCDSAYKEIHYQRGIQFFGAEKPDAAIAEWEMVRQLDPGYKQVDQYIKKAETISQKIKKLKQKSN